MSDDTFDVKILAEKLLKLNNSQQSIESLSRWCITHRKKAKQVVETWEKMFNPSQKEQRVSFLYLANDILQNSRRKGSEFVNEFWKVLPAALKHVYESGDEYGKKAVVRLVDIWEERKVFGSRGKSLKDEMLGKDPPPVSANNGKSSNPIKTVKRDAHTVRLKLTIGALPEKILTGFQTVLDEHLNEEATLSKCSAAVHLVGKLENIEKTSTLGNQQAPAFLDELQQQESVLQQCVGQLERFEASRAALISQLKEALEDQESKLQLIQTRLQVARGQIEQVNNIRSRVTLPAAPGPPHSGASVLSETGRVVEQNMPPVQPSGTPPQPLMQPVLSFAPSKITEEDNKKAAAAAVAAKLAASTSSAQMLTSVLSSLVAEEAANSGLKSSGPTAGLSMFSPEKRLKLDRPMPLSDASNSEVGNGAYTQQHRQQPVTSIPPSQSSSLQPMSQANQVQAAFAANPPPPPPSVSHANPPTNQYVQSLSAGLMAGVVPYNYGTNALPPPPPLPPHIAMGLARPAQPPQQSPPQQPSSQQQPQPSQQQPQPSQQPAGGYYRPPGIGFYGQSQPTAPPVPRQ